MIALCAECARKRLLPGYARVQNVARDTAGNDWIASVREAVGDGDPSIVLACMVAENKVAWAREDLSRVGRLLTDVLQDLHYHVKAEAARRSQFDRDFPSALPNRPVYEPKYLDLIAELKEREVSLRAREAELESQVVQEKVFYHLPADLAGVRFIVEVD